MLKPVSQISVLCPYVHPEQEINQRYRQSVVKNKTKENIWDVDPKPYH